MTRSNEIQPDSQDLLIPITVDVSSPDAEPSDDFDEELTFSQRASVVRRVARADVADEVAEIRERAQRELAVVEAARAVEFEQARERARRSIRRSKMLTVATGVATSVLAMVLCINSQGAALEVDSGGGLDPAVSHQLEDWTSWVTGGSASAVPEAQAEVTTPTHTVTWRQQVSTSSPAASDTLFDTTNCGDPNDPLNFCL
jgi:hypothetical protein